MEIANEEVVIGYCMHRRWRSKKLLFYDLATDASEESGNIHLRIQKVVKKYTQLILQYPVLSIEKIEEYRRAISLGDCIEVRGHYE